MRPALQHICGQLHVFYSEGDKLWLEWRTGNFGTYDNIKTPAAGHTGFQSADALPPELRGKLVQHAYEPAWADLGNDGGHNGWLAGDFVRQVVAPLLKR